MKKTISTCVSPRATVRATNNTDLLFCGTEPVITVREIRSQNSGSEVLVRVLTECGEHREQTDFVLSIDRYCLIKPERGRITEEMYDRLEAAAELCRATRCGENLLSYGSNSAQVLARKIMQHGFTREVALEAVEHLTARGLIDENADLRREAERCVRKLWGSKRITAQLWSKGFGTEAMALLPQILSEIDFPAQCAQLIRKHYGGVPSDAEDYRRMMAGLSRYGYTMGEIREAVRSEREAQGV